MSKSIFLYFQIHQPYRINNAELGDNTKWQDFFVGQELGKLGLDMRNETIFNKVATSCYIPTTEFWLNQLQKHPELHFTLSFSGTFLEQCQDYPNYGSQVLDLFRQIVATGRVEILDETYYHSLAFLVDLQEYLDQIRIHRRMIEKLFNYSPESFRNTELIYNNHIGEIIQKLGYKTILIEDAWWNRQSKLVKEDSVFINEKIVLGASEQELLRKYQISEPQENLKILLRDTDSSDGIMFIGGKPEYLADSIVNSPKTQLGVFTDYEFMGEHSSLGDTIFVNLENQIINLMKSDCKFNLIKNLEVENPEIYSCPEYSSWGHKERDISVWRGGQAQEDAFAKLLELFNFLKKHDRLDLLEAWRKLSTSCHLYFLGQKTGFDADFVDLFSPYNSVQEALEMYLSVSNQIFELAKKPKLT